MKRILFLISSFLAATSLFAESLSGTITGTVDKTDTSFTVDAGKTLQIGDGDIEGILNINLPSGTFKNNGKLIVAENGTLNIVRTGSPYGSVGYVGTADIYGKLIISSGSFWDIGKSNVFGNASIKGAMGGTGSVLTVNTSTADFTKSEFRVDQSSSAYSTINLNAANAIATMGSVKMIYWANVSSKLVVNVGKFENIIPKVRLNKDVSMTVNMEGSNKLTIAKICFDDDAVVTDLDPTKVIAKIVLNNFENDKILIQDISRISIDEATNTFKTFQDSKSAYSYLNISATDSSGKAIDGKWSLVEAEGGGYWLNNSGAIPEPATLAAILGLLALGIVLRRK